MPICLQLEQNIRVERGKVTDRAARTSKLAHTRSELPSIFSSGATSKPHRH